MGTLEPKDVGQVVKQATQVFLHQRECVANRPNLLALVHRLERYTDQVQEEAERTGLGSDTNVAQWARDMENWRTRLALYFDALEKGRHDTGPEACDEYRATVSEPLFVGWFPPNYPGIVNPDVQSVADIATPYILGNQVVEYGAFQRERFEKLLDDLTPTTLEEWTEIGSWWGEGLADLFGIGEGSQCDWRCWGRRITGGVALAGGAYLTYRFLRWEARRRRRAEEISP